MSGEVEKKNIKQPFDAKFLRGILLKFVLEPNLCAKFYNYLDPEMFDRDTTGALRKIAETILGEVLTKPVDLSTLDGLLQLQPDGVVREASLKELSDMRTDPSNLAFAQSDTAFDLFLRWLKANTFVKSYQDVRSLFNAGSFDTAYDSLENTLTDIRNISRDEVEEADFDHAQEFLEQNSVTGPLSKLCLGLDAFDVQSGLEKQTMTLFLSTTGGGKCLSPSTPVLMFDGSIKAAKYVVLGDKVMGPDSTARNVVGTTKGRSEMFKVTPVKGESWYCNGPHILSLVHTSTGKITDISVEDYLETSKTFKHLHKQYRVGADFTEQPLPVEPYLFGVWIGGGTLKEPVISKSDKELVDYLVEAAPRHGVQARVVTQKDGHLRISLTNGKENRGRTNPLWQGLREGAVEGEKRIPQKYLVNSRENRLQLLAGLLDTDGYMHHNFYEFSTKYEQLAQQVAFLARSLGFAAYSKSEVKGIKATKFEGTYWKVSISGNVGLIPCKIKRKQARPRLQVKDALRTGIEVKSIGEGDYCGFELDGDHRFLLGDFTVTHNSMMSIHLLLRAIEEEKYVYLCCLEDRKLSVMRRLLAAMTGISINEFKDPTAMQSDQARAKIREAQIKLKKFVKLEFIYGVSPRFLLDRVKELDAIRLAKGLPVFDMVVFDYLQHVAHLAPGSDASHEKLTRAHADFKDYVLKQKKIGITFMQVNRAGSKTVTTEGLLGAHDIAGAYNAAFVADQIISINRSPEQKERNECILYVVKGREGAGEMRFEVPTDFARARYKMGAHVHLNAVG